MKHEQPSTEDRFDAVRRCFEAYGADVDKWPAEKRDAFGALAASDEMAAAREDALALDGFLNAATAPRASHDLKNRIAAQIDLPQQAARGGGVGLGAFLAGFRLAPLRVAPVGALAGIGALGLATGFLTANAQVAQTPEYEAYAYLEYSGALLNEEEIVQWDAD